MHRLPLNPEPLLALFMRKESAGSLAGDIEERFQRMCADRGRAAAILWFWRALLISIPSITFAALDLDRNRPRVTFTPRAPRRPDAPNDAQPSLEFLRPVPATPRKLSATVEAVICCDAPVAAPMHRGCAAAIDGGMILTACGLFFTIFNLLGGTFPVSKPAIAVMGAAPVLIAMFYGFVWVCVGGRTPGMRALHLTLINFDGNPPDGMSRWLRYLGASLGYCAGGLGLLWGLLDEESLAWHDHISKTFPTFHGPENNPFPVCRIMDNLYYVGTEDVASYLIVTPKGHFLLNSGYEDTPAMIRRSVDKLGFKITDVKILLNSQAHFDHVAGQAVLQKMTGAKIYSSEREFSVLESGGKTDPQWGREVTYPPVHVDHVVADGERVTLGGVTLTAHLTPGHSIGCTTWTMQVTDAGKIYDVVFVGGTAINPGVRLVDHPTYPGIAEDFKKTFQTLRSLKCDVFLGAHGGYYGMIEKFSRLEKGAQPNPFIDPEGYRAYVDAAEAHFLDQLSAEKVRQP